MHRGALKARKDCRLLEVNAVVFQDIVSGLYAQSVFDPRQYAADFAEKLSGYNGEVTDLFIKEVERTTTRTEGGVVARTTGLKEKLSMSTDILPVPTGVGRGRRANMVIVPTGP